MNRNKIAGALDACLARINRGEAMAACLPDYAGVREELEPLLATALSLSSLRPVSPADDFRRAARGRLMARLQREAYRVKTVELEQSLSPLDDLAAAARRFWQAVALARKVAAPVALGVVLAVVTLFSASNFIAPSPTLASGATLSILSGSVEVQVPASQGLARGSDGMTLDIGTRIKTAADSHALLTFFDGSTLKLEPGTDIEIQKLETGEAEAVTIVLKQWAGKTWSRVVKMADAGSHYEIDPPTASAIVRGTLFATEVEEDGATTVATTQGLVSVIGQGEEVLPASRQTRVAAGASPSGPEASPAPAAEITITIDRAAVGSLTDPTGASTGSLPTGRAFNQIAGSQSESSADDTQVIRLPQLTSGEYTLAMRFVADGTVRFKIQGQSGGETAFRYAGAYQGQSDSGWLLRFSLRVENGLITGHQLSNVEPLGDTAPEKIVKTQSVKNAGAPAVPTARDEKGRPAGNDENNKENNGNGQGQASAPGQDRMENQGNSLTPSAPGQAGAPGQNKTGVQAEAVNTDISPDKVPADNRDEIPGQARADEAAEPTVPGNDKSPASADAPGQEKAQVQEKGNSGQEQGNNGQDKGNNGQGQGNARAQSDTQGYTPAQAAGLPPAPAAWSALCASGAGR